MRFDQLIAGLCLLSLWARRRWLVVYLEARAWKTRGTLAACHPYLEHTSGFSPLKVALYFYLLQDWKTFPLSLYLRPRPRSPVKATRPSWQRVLQEPFRLWEEVRRQRGDWGEGARKTGFKIDRNLIWSSERLAGNPPDRRWKSKDWLQQGPSNRSKAFTSLLWVPWIHWMQWNKFKEGWLTYHYNQVNKYHETW